MKWKLEMKDSRPEIREGSICPTISSLSPISPLTSVAPSPKSSTLLAHPNPSTFPHPYRTPPPLSSLHLNPSPVHPSPSPALRPTTSPTEPLPTPVLAPTLPARYLTVRSPPASSLITPTSPSLYPYYARSPPTPNSGALPSLPHSQAASSISRASRRPRSTPS